MRQPEPYYRKDRRRWAVQINGKQHNLGPDKAEAFAQYHVLMAGRTGAQSPNATCATIIAEFLKWTRDNRAGSTYEFYYRPCAAFAAHVGVVLKASDLKPYHLTKFLDKLYPVDGVSGNYRGSAIRTVKRAFEWATQEGYLISNPLGRYKKPKATPSDRLVTDLQWVAVIDALESWGEDGQSYLDFITIMRQTGCRPQEARTCEASYLDRRDKCLVFPRDKSKGRVTQRVVPLTDIAFELCSRLALKHPSGPIFRNSHGTPWTRYSLKAWAKRLDGRNKKMPSWLNRKRVDFRLSVKAIRHTWATEALTRGVDPITVATIMGHTSVKQLMETYQHLNRKSGHLRTMLHVAVGAVPLVPATR